MNAFDEFIMSDAFFPVVIVLLVLLFLILNLPPIHYLRKEIFADNVTVAWKPVPRGLFPRMKSMPIFVYLITR